MHISSQQFSGEANDRRSALGFFMVFAAAMVGVERQMKRKAGEGGQVRYTRRAIGVISRSLWPKTREQLAELVASMSVRLKCLHVCCLRETKAKCELKIKAQMRQTGNETYYFIMCLQAVKVLWRTVESCWGDRILFFAIFLFVVSLVWLIMGSPAGFNRNFTEFILFVTVQLRSRLFTETYSSTTTTPLVPVSNNKRLWLCNTPLNCANVWCERTIFIHVLTFHLISQYLCILWDMKSQ